MSDRTSRHSLCDVECQIKCQILTESSGCRIACQNRFHTERQNSCQIKNQKRSEYFLRWGSHEVKQFWQLMNCSSQALVFHGVIRLHYFAAGYWSSCTFHFHADILPAAYYRIIFLVSLSSLEKTKNYFFTHRQDSDDSKSSTSDPDGSRSVWEARLAVQGQHWFRQCTSSIAYWFHQRGHGPRSTHAHTDTLHTE